MPNTVTQILPVLFSQGLLALREACVLPRLVNLDFDPAPANTGDTVNVMLPTAQTATDVTPGPTPVTPPDIAPVRVPITLNQWKKAGFHLTDKQRAEIANGLEVAQVSEAIRALANAVNASIFALYTKVYGMHGTAGTTPFGGTDLADASGVRKVLNRQLAPETPRRMVLDVEADANLVRHPYIAATYARGGSETNRTGRYGAPVMGFEVFYDHQVPLHTSPAFSAGAVTVNGAHTIGAGSTDGGRTGTVSIAKATNSHNLLAGDILTFAGDPQTYTVLANVTLIVGNTTVSIAPALTTAKTGGEAVTKVGTHRVNLAFHRDAIAFASRRLASASAEPGRWMSVADPVSGLGLRLEVIRQNKQDYWEFDLLWGVELVRPEFAARLLG